MKIFRSIQTKLFFSYSSLITLIILVFVTSFYFYTSRTLEKNSSESIHQLSLNVSDKLDTELKTMNSIAGRIIASQPVKELFFANAETPTTQLNNSWNITSVLFSITGHPFPFYQINLFRTNGHFVEFGKNFDVFEINTERINEKAWVKSALEKDGKMHIVPPRKNDWDDSNKVVISLARAFSEVFGAKMDSVVEIQLDYQVFSNLIERSVTLPGEENSHNIQVFVYDSSGKILYPFSGTDLQPKDYWEVLKKQNAQYSIVKLPGGSSRQGEILAFTRSEFTGWTVALVESEFALLQPVRTFGNNILLFGLAALFLTMVLTYFVSKGLTTPIKKIRKSIKNLSLQALTPKSPLPEKESLNELEDLNLSFMEMCKRLEESLEEVVLAKSHEIQANMLALQAQMNPHFLYNTLSVISIKAEKNDAPDIVKMCEDLSDMLRYVAEGNAKPVTIARELDYTVKYLDLMKTRYPNQFECSMSISAEMYAIVIPRLIIQPLVENCFKYAFNTRPPWKIEIAGRLTSHMWEITVSDNGKGFQADVLQELKDKIAHGEPEFPGIHELHERQKGLGLLNIYFRLKLLYNEQALFEISNQEGGGGKVTVGGSIPEGGGLG